MGSPAVVVQEIDEDGRETGVAGGRETGRGHGHEALGAGLAHLPHAVLAQAHEQRQLTG